MRLRAAVLLVGALGASLGAGLTDGEWDAAARHARSLMREPAKAEAKQRTVRFLATDDSARAADFLADWAKDSLRLLHGKLGRERDEAKEHYDRLLARVAKSSKGTVSIRSLRSARTRFDEARLLFDAETRTIEAIAAAFAGFRNPDAAALLCGPRAHDLREDSRLREGLLRCLLEQKGTRFVETILGYATDPSVRSRLLVMDWVAGLELAAGFDACAASLGSGPRVAQRAAIHALERINDGRAVPCMIAQLARASGQLAADLEDALYRFTGQPYRGADAPGQWDTWWKEHGDAWLHAKTQKRFASVDRESEGDIGFYGVATRSRRIVFVLDINESIFAEPQGEKSVAWIKTLKQRLARTIAALPADARFNVVLFGDRVVAFRAPPGLLPATDATKAAAIGWLDAATPSVGRRTLAAMRKALEFAAPLDEGSVDTILLVSDGPARGSDGKEMRESLVEKLYGRFLKANRTYRCVVHTIGLGPGHDRKLMRRFAEDSGGEYRPVGLR